MTGRTITVSTRSVTRKPNTLPTDDKRRRGNGGLTKRVKAAIEAQVFDGLRRAEAAQKAGIAEHTLYQALRKPSVLSYWNECLQVLRTGERARNVHRLVEIRDQDDNKTAAVQAVKVLEEAADHRASSAPGRVTTPGVVIVIGGSRDGRVIADQGLIEINPLTDNEDVPNADSEQDE